MSKKIFELKNQRNELVDLLEKNLSDGDTKAFDEGMKKVKDLNEEIRRLEDLDIERGRFESNETDKVEAYKMMDMKKEDAARFQTLDACLSEKEYARAFCDAIRNGVTRKNIANGFYGEKYAPLRNALTIAGGETPGEDGGFLVPMDVSTQIHEFRRQLVSLADLVNVENVTAPTGTRPYDVKPTTGFTKIDNELDPIPNDDEPEFRQIPYTTEKYGLFIQLSNELLQDEDANLLNYISRWFARKQVLTENEIILSKLNEIEASTFTGTVFDGVKTALNTLLDPSISDRAKILVNQTGFNAMDLVKDTTGNYMMNADLTRRMGFVLENDTITRVPNWELSDLSGKTPIFIGDFADYMTLFRRKYLEVDSTAVGGAAWRNYGFEIRGITRLGASVFDNEAVVKLEVEADGAKPSEGGKKKKGIKTVNPAGTSTTTSTSDATNG